MNKILRTLTLLRRWAGVLLALSIIALAVDVYAHAAGSAAMF